MSETGDATHEIAENLRKLADYIISLVERTSILEEANRNLKESQSGEQVRLDKHAEANDLMFETVNTELANHEKRITAKEQPAAMTWTQFGAVLGAAASAATVVAWLLNVTGLIH